MVTSRLLVVSALFVAAPFAAFASSDATVGVKIAELRIKPDDQAFSRLKMPAGREVAVLGKSDDGRWIKVRAQIEKGDDIIKLEGWVEAAQLKGADTASLEVAAGGSTASASSKSAFGDEPAAASSDTEWAAPSEPAASASSGEAWDSMPATASETPAASSDSGPAWDSGTTSETPAPAGDEWDSGSSSGSSDSSSSDSSGSSDGW